MGAIREELAVLRTIEEHHRRLGSRLTLLFLATIVVDLAEPRVILLDVVLPDMSGYETCRTVRAVDGINDP